MFRNNHFGTNHFAAQHFSLGDRLADVMKNAFIFWRNRIALVLTRPFTEREYYDE